MHTFADIVHVGNSTDLEVISNIKEFDKLPEAAKKYILRVEELIGCKITSIGVGPGRDQNIER